MASMYDTLENNYLENFRKMRSIVGKPIQEGVIVRQTPTIEDINTTNKIKSIIMSKKTFAFFGILVSVILLLAFTKPYNLVTDYDEENDSKNINYLYLIIYSIIISSVLFGVYCFYMQ